MHFDPESHTYTNTVTGRKYISVTTLLGKYKKPFDTDGHSKRVAKREGVPQELVLEMWKLANDTANEKGHRIHKLLEDYLVEGTVDPKYTPLYETFEAQVGSRIGEYDEVLSEYKLYDHDYELAGTADLVFCHKKDTFTIGDFKTNKNYNFTSKYCESLLFPIEHLHNCEFNVYALQLSIYAYMYEKHTKKKCRGLVVFYLENGKWVPVSCNYLKNDVIAILSDYKEKYDLDA